MATVKTAKRKKTKTPMRSEKIFNESGKGYWMEGFGCLRAEGENRPSRPGHVVCYAIEGNVVDRVSAKNGKGWCEDVSPTLNTQDRHAVVYALEGNGARPSHMGKGWSEDGTMYTLNTIEQHSVCYGLSRACYTGGETSTGGMPIEKDISPTIMARGPGCVCYDARGNGEGDVAPAMTGDHNRRVSDYSALVVVTKENKEMTAYSAGNGQLHQVQLTDVSDTLDCMHDQKMVLMEGNEMRPERKYVLRRLTPTECLRLQGLPDWWCDGANGSDTAIYKMAGNGLAIPCAADVLGRIAEAMENGE